MTSHPFNPDDFVGSDVRLVDAIFLLEWRIKALTQIFDQMFNVIEQLLAGHTRYDEMNETLSLRLEDLILRIGSLERQVGSLK